MTAMRAVGLLVALALAGCVHPEGSTRPSAAAPGRVSGIERVELEVTLSGTPASRYGAHTPWNPSALERAIARRLEPLPGRFDPSLSRVARELARLAPHILTVPPQLVEAVMAHMGLPDPSPRLTIVEVEGDYITRCDRPRLPASCVAPVAALVEEARASFPRGQHVIYGVGVARAPGGGGTRLIAATLERSVQLDPVPKRAPLGEEVRITGHLLGGRRQPSLETTDARGQWRRRSVVRGDDASFAGTVTCRHRGLLQVEVLAVGAHGPEVVANMPLYCHADPPVRLRLSYERLGPNVPPQAIARANLDALNEARARRGLAPLAWHGRAAEVARAHARDMAQHGYVGHVSPRTGDVSQRFARAGVRAAVVRENVARGYGPRQIHDSLMRSPGHRVNLLADDVTHVGIGVFLAPAESDAPGAPRPIFLVQNFLREPGAGAPARGDLTRALRRQVEAHLERAGRPRPRWHAALGKAAVRQAQAVASGRPIPDQAPVARALAQEGYRAIERLHLETNDFQALVRADLWRDIEGPVGLGAARKRVDGEDRFVLVVLVGVR